jgi:hypothetical protein
MKDRLLDGVFTEWTFGDSPLSGHGVFIAGGRTTRLVPSAAGKRNHRPSGGQDWWSDVHPCELASSH